MITIENGPYNEWAPWVTMSLSKLCYRWGAMSDEVRMNPKTLTWVAFDGNRVLGWALVTEDPYDDKWSLMFYTNKKYRGQGAGRKLYKEIMKWHRHLPIAKKYSTVIFPDWENKGFFKKVGRRDISGSM